MELATGLLDNPPTSNPPRTTKQHTYSERNRAVAAFLCCEGFTCLEFAYGEFIFADTSITASRVAGGFYNRSTVEPQQFLRELARLKGKEEQWQREHQLCDGQPQDHDGFFQVKHSFWRNPKLSKNAKLVGMSMASHANKLGISYPGVHVIAAECGIKKGTIKPARQELIDEGCLKKHSRHNPDGTFNGWEYEVTSKMIHRRSKRN